MPIAVLEEIHTLHIRLAVKGSVWDWISEQPQVFYYVANNLNKQSDCSFLGDTRGPIETKFLSAINVGVLTQQDGGLNRLTQHLILNGKDGCVR